MSSNVAVVRAAKRILNAASGPLFVPHVSLYPDRMMANLPPAYSLAIKAARQAAATVADVNDPNVEVAVGSFLFWIVAIDDRVRELNPVLYSAMREQHPESHVMPGLKLARNALGHGVVPVSRPAGFTFPLTIPFTIPPWRWTSLAELLEGWTQTKTNHLPQQKKAYLDYLAERPIVETLQRAMAWIERYADVELGTPNCPVDLVPMVAEGDGERARWVCPECGLARL